MPPIRKIFNLAGLAVAGGLAATAMHSGKANATPVFSDGQNVSLSTTPGYSTIFGPNLTDTVTLSSPSKSVLDGLFYPSLSINGGTPFSLDIACDDVNDVMPLNPSGLEYTVTNLPYNATINGELNALYANDFANAMSTATSNPDPSAIFQGAVWEIVNPGLTITGSPAVENGIAQALENIDNGTWKPDSNIELLQLTDSVTAPTQSLIVGQTTVDEPGSIALLGAGLVAGVGAMALRRRRGTGPTAAPG